MAHVRCRSIYLRPLLEIKCNFCRKNNLLHEPFVYQLFAVHMEYHSRAKLDCNRNKRDRHHCNMNLSIYMMTLNWNRWCLPVGNNYPVSKNF